MTLLLEIPKVRRRNDVPIIGTLAEGFPHQHQPRRIWERERFQQSVLDYAEDGRIGADSERQRQHRHDGERGGSDQVPQTVADILKNRSEQGGHPSQYSARVGRLLRFLTAATNAGRRRRETWILAPLPSTVTKPPWLVEFSSLILPTRTKARRCARMKPNWRARSSSTFR